MFDVRTRFGLTLEEVSMTDNEYTPNAVEVLQDRLRRNDFSEFSDEEADVICYALAFGDEDDE